MSQKIGNVCGVCFQEISFQEVGVGREVASRCGHIFHSTCIGETLNRDGCPICNRNVSSQASENVIREEYIVITAVGLNNLP